MTDRQDVTTASASPLDRQPAAAPRRASQQILIGATLTGHNVVQSVLSDFDLKMEVLSSQRVATAAPDTGTATAVCEAIMAVGYACSTTTGSFIE